ncbi:MAG: hypothetical protein IJO83_08325 [Clostridia bacterium]|nr:hypothetical protein [Clostridia bacterium]
MKKLLAYLLAVFIFTTVISVPCGAKAEGLKVWKFDFTADGTSKDGYISVTPDMHVINNDNRPYGFIGTNEKDYRLHGGRIDGFDQVMGQVIKLSATKNGVGSLGITNEAVTEFNSGDYYPVRFALKSEGEAYYKIKATVTTLDGKTGAEASLYTERKHPIFTKKKIAPGERVESEFTVRVTPVYYEKSDPKGLYEDKYLSVCLLGENAALEKLVIEEIPTAPTLWILGDSTVTDGGGGLPFFPLNTYTGVGTGVTKYLTETIAVVNEGEGGLSAHDNNHFNVVKSRIKEGDFLWVEYGHNHKGDGVAGYESVIGKYYDVCKKVGATLILVGPIDRINNYDAATNTWYSSLKGFSDAAKKFVDTKLNANPDEKIAFVDLNAPSLEWFGKRTKEGNVGGQQYTNEKKLVYFYFQAGRGAKDVDHTHPNDVGAENLAYLFFENADCEAYPALKPLLTRFKEGRSETPTPVDQGIMDKGFPANNAWAYWSGKIKYEYPLEITNVEINEKNEIVRVMCKLLDKDALSSYAAAFVEMDGKTYQSTIESHIDNSAAKDGSLYTLEFKEGERAVVDGAPYRVYMAGVDMADGDKKLEGIKPFSKDYTPGKYSEHVLRTADGDVEKFEYYGYNTLTGSGDWGFGGNLSENSLGYEGEKSLVSLRGNGFSLSRALAVAVGTGGRYEFGVDVKNATGKVKFTLANGWRGSVPFAQGYNVTLFEINNGTVMLNGEAVGTLKAGEWNTVSAVLDMDEGKLKVKLGEAEKEVLLDAYRSFIAPEADNMYRFVITGEGNAEIMLSSLWGAKCNLYDKTKVMVSVATEGAEYGSVLIGGESTGNKEKAAGDTVKLTAVSNPEGRFMGWYRDGEEYSVMEEIEVRLYDSFDVTAKFAKQTPKTSVTVEFSDNKGKIIKSESFNTDINGRKLHEEMKFTLDEKLKEPIVLEKDGYKEVYLLKEARNEVIESLLPEGENKVELIFENDGKYLIYEEFDNNDTWGFDKEVRAGEGRLYLLTGVGTANRQSSVKALDEGIKSLKKLTVRFMWKSNVDTAKGRNSAFELLDESGNALFSIRAKGKDGISFAPQNGEETVISGDYKGVNDIYEVTISFDFDQKIMTGSVKNHVTNDEFWVESVGITGGGIEKISATYGYSSAEQELYSFMVRDDGETASQCEIKREGKSVTVTIKSDKSGKRLLVAGIYENGSLKAVYTKNVLLDEKGEGTVTFETEHVGEIKATVF